MSNADRDSYLKGSPPGRSRARDLVIVVSMALVSIAFGAGLLVNGGFGLGPSVIGGLGLFVLLMFMHTIMRRLQTLSSERGASGAASETSDAAMTLDHGSPPAGERRAAAGSPAVAADDGEHGWGEPAAVNDLVRQLATELKKAPDTVMPAAVAPIPPPPIDPRAETARPMPAPARPLASARTPSPVERQASRPVPPRAPVSPVAVAREDIIEVVQRAIETEDIEIHLQPVMSLADRRTQLYEAFPRIRDGNGGFIRPETYARSRE